MSVRLVCSIGKLAVKWESNMGMNLRPANRRYISVGLSTVLFLMFVQLGFGGQAFASPGCDRVHDGDWDLSSAIPAGGPEVTIDQFSAGDNIKVNLSGVGQAGGFRLWNAQTNVIVLQDNAVAGQPKRDLPYLVTGNNDTVLRMSVVANANGFVRVHVSCHCPCR
jgi:hypothetical protein